MPSPFPGMDPYLESPELWTDFHTNLATSIQGQLAPRLRPEYFVAVERRVYILSEEDPGRRTIQPDVSVVRAAERPTPTSSKRSTAPAAGVLLTVLEEVEIEEPRLVIRDARSRRVVTVLEILSPTNKSRGSKGREEYLSKRREILRSRTHLVEIDLLREGLRFPTVDELPAGDYFVHVSRIELRPKGEFYAWRLRDPLPVVPVPLARQSDTEIDLGQALSATYDRVGYDLQIDYSRPPDPPFSKRDRAWARRRVAER